VADPKKLLFSLFSDFAVKLACFYIKKAFIFIKITYPNSEKWKKSSLSQIESFIGLKPAVNFINFLLAHFSYKILAPKPKRT